MKTKILSLYNKDVMREIKQTSMEEYIQVKRMRYAFYIAKCSQIQKEIIEMHFFARPPQTFREISRHLNLPLSKVYREYRRGLKILADFFKEEQNDKIC